MNKDQLLEIKILARDFYKKQDFFHNETHAKQVNKFAKKIAKDNKQVDPFLLESGVWLHQMHDNLDELDCLLKKINLSKENEKTLRSMVNNCRPNKIINEKSLEGKIVYDADALCVLSIRGFFRELLCNAFVRNLKWKNNKANAKKIEKSFRKTLQIEATKALSKDFEKWTKFLKKLLLF